MRVQHPPPRPLLIWDGDCHFCGMWIARWRDETGGALDYAKSQEVAKNYPEIASSVFANSVVLITPDGQSFRGADAVFRGREFAGQRWPLAFYRKSRAFAALTEFGYAMVAQHRQIASTITRLLWGNDVRRPQYFATRRIFLRALGLIYLIAFVSLGTQIDGLVGGRGVLPARDFFDAVREQYGAGAFWLLPSVCWFNASNAMLHALCAIGVIASAILLIGLVPIPALVICFASYLSLAIAGQSFLSFQWDILLLETGFLAIFFAPWQWRLACGHDARPSAIALFLLKFLLFKLMFMSGVVKLTSGDDCWWKLTALDWHYWTQPLPTTVAWFANLHPEWFKKFAVAFCIVVEIIVPFFLWAPRRLRYAAAALLIALQIAIALTGNYCFFNLLTIALCLLLLDDTIWGRRSAEAAAGDSGYRVWRVWVPSAVLVVTLPFNLWLNYNAIRPEAEWPRWLGSAYSRIEAFRIVNGYGLFRVMTKERPEIQIEGSANGIAWTPYEFKWKPGDVNRAPGWVAPHQPRLDWQMWFAALGSRHDRAMVANLMMRLLENESSVTRLLARNPFATKPPRFVRAVLFQYEFTTRTERDTTGGWWKRREIGEYLPELSLPE